MYLSGICKTVFAAKILLKIVLEFLLHLKFCLKIDFLKHEINKQNTTWNYNVNEYFLVVVSTNCVN